MSELTKIQNIGAELARRMKLAGINSLEEFKDLGSEEAWLRIRELTPQACMNNLMALEGAI